MFIGGAQVTGRVTRIRAVWPEPGTLTLTLRQLERDGLVVRTVHAEVPPRVEYELTAMGSTLVDSALALAKWAIEHHPTIEASRARYDARAASPVG